MRKNVCRVKICHKIAECNLCHIGLRTQIISEKMVSVYMYFSCAASIYLQLCLMSWHYCVLLGLVWGPGRSLQQKAAVKLASVGPNGDGEQAKRSDIIFPKGSLTVVVFSADVSSLTGHESYPTQQPWPQGHCTHRTLAPQTGLLPERGIIVFQIH